MELRVVYNRNLNLEIVAGKKKSGEARQPRLMAISTLRGAAPQNFRSISDTRLGSRVFRPARYAYFSSFSFL